MVSSSHLSTVARSGKPVAGIGTARILRGGGCRGAQAERKAQQAIEVAPAERGVVAVGQPEAGLGQALAGRERGLRLGLWAALLTALDPALVASSWRECQTSTPSI